MPALIYDVNCWTFYDKYEKNLATAEMKMLRMSLGVTKLDPIPNEKINQTTMAEKNGMKYMD